MALTQLSPLQSNGHSVYCLVRLCPLVTVSGVVVLSVLLLSFSMWLTEQYITPVDHMSPYNIALDMVSN